MTDTTQTTDLTIRERIDRVYRELTGSESSHGSLEWFRQEVSSGRDGEKEIAWKTVHRWASGRRPISPPALRILEILEDRAGLDPDEGKES